MTINRALTGDYNATIAKLLLGKHGYSDKLEAAHSGGVRPVEHVVTGVEGDRADELGRAAGTVGFSVTTNDGDRMVLVHQADPTDITPDSWTLRLIAERHGATYDGWGCEERAPLSSTKPKRRWRRR